LTVVQPTFDGAEPQPVVVVLPQFAPLIGASRPQFPSGLVVTDATPVVHAVVLVVLWVQQNPATFGLSVPHPSQVAVTVVQFCPRATTDEAASESAAARAGTPT
jgi:hypothetical protein